MKSIDKLRRHVYDTLTRSAAYPINDMIDEIEREMADMVPLPVDADGVPIRAGDVLDGYGKTIEVVEIRHGRSGWVLVSRGGNGYADTFAFTHHHAPTVEDVLLEACKAYHGLMVESMSDVAHDMPVPSEVIAEYAARLQLKEG